MKVDEIAKDGIVGGIVAIVLVFLASFVASSGIVFIFGFIALILGGFAAGWMAKGAVEDAIAAGALSGIIYAVLGLYIIYPLFGHIHAGSITVAIVVSLILGLVGGFAGNYLGMGKAGAKRMGNKR